MLPPNQTWPAKYCYGAFSTGSAACKVQPTANPNVVSVVQENKPLLLELQLRRTKRGFTPFEASFIRKVRHNWPFNTFPQYIYTQKIPDLSDELFRQILSPELRKIAQNRFLEASGKLKTKQISIFNHTLNRTTASAGLKWHCWIMPPEILSSF